MQPTLLSLFFCAFALCACSFSGGEQGQELVKVSDLEMRGEQFDQVAYFNDTPFSGMAVTYANGGIKYIEQEYKNGRPEGIWRVYFPNGQLQKEGQKTDGFEDGEYREWYDNGNLKYEYHYDKGEKTGKWLSWYEDGTRYTERNFVNDLVHGKVLVYDEIGRLAKEYDYREGKLVHQEMHFKNFKQE